MLRYRIYIYLILLHICSILGFTMQFLSKFTPFFSSVEQLFPSKNCQNSAIIDRTFATNSFLTETMDTQKPTTSQIIDQLSLSEQISLLSTQLGINWIGHTKPEKAIGSAGYNAGLPNHGIPPLQITDAALGIGTTDFTPAADKVTAFPSALALGSTFMAELAEEAGRAVGEEASIRGFNVLLAGGCNLVRDPRGGRSFESYGEDPFHVGHFTGSYTKGVQSCGVVTALKHYVLASQETGRPYYNALLSETGLQESDLLAFHIALKIGNPGAIMLAQHYINGTHLAEHSHLLSTILKEEWQFRGWVLSEWGGTPSCETAALAGLDQESARELDISPHFTDTLMYAIQRGTVSRSKIRDMAHRVVTGLSIGGAYPARTSLPMTDDVLEKQQKSHYELARTISENAMVLLKNNNNVLPLSQNSAKKIAFFGGHSNEGVLSGGGSSQVIPPNALAFKVDKIRGAGIPLDRIYHPSSPVEALKRLMPESEIIFHNGENIKEAAQLARTVDVCIVVAEQWLSEGMGALTLDLDNEQNPLISSIALANPKTIVVLFTGGPVKMPWLDQACAVIEGWYPGIGGGEALARLLTGTVNFSGRLPVTFPTEENQLPRLTMTDPDITQATLEKIGLIDISYNREGSDVGYKWYRKNMLTPLFPFGFGLSYTQFHYNELRIDEREGKLIASFDIINGGLRAGRDVPQLYVSHTGDNPFVRRLAAFQSITLEAGEWAHISIPLDKKIFASYNESKRQWAICGGRYVISLAAHADDERLQNDITLSKEIIPL